MSAMFDCDLEFQEEKEFYPESEDDDLEVSSGGESLRCFLDEIFELV